MYELDDNIMRLIGSPVVEDVVLGFSIVKNKFGDSYFTDQMVEVREGLYANRASAYLFKGIVNRHDWTLIKVDSCKVIIHLFSSSLHFHTYKEEYDAINSPKYKSFKVFEI